MSKEIGFISEPTEAERLIAMLQDENSKLLQSLDSTQRELIETKNKLNNANERLAQVNNKVVELTPYMDSARVYIGDTLVKFENVVGNIVTAYCETDSGLVIPTRVERANNTVNVFFESLEEVAMVTISVI